jgi:hypothetical protein
VALIGLASLARMAFSGADLAPVGAQLLARAAENPADADALMDMSTVLHLRGNRDLGLALQAQALDLRQVYRVGTGEGLKVLVLVSPGDLTENNVLEFLLEESGVTLEMLYVSLELPLPSPVPEHDLAFVAVCETDLNRPLLAHLENILADWPRPVLNLPGRIARLSRDGACAVLGAVPGAHIPTTVRIDRHSLGRIGEGESLKKYFGGGFPVIVRPVDSHKGQGLAKLEDPVSVLDYMCDRPETFFYLSPFVDYHSADGQYRKYRIVLIKGRPFVCHMAISSHWMVHYMSADMTGSAAKRAEERQFMEDFDYSFAIRHRDAIAALDDRLQLDYVGFDCGEAPDGRLLVFEVDSGMTVHAMDGADTFPYKQVQMKKVFQAFREMLEQAAG